MKKNISISFIIIVSIFLLITGCQTTSSNRTESNGKGFSPTFSIFEKQTWISFQTVELFQDDDSLYISLHYSSNTAGKYSLFNPPKGTSFMLKGVLIKGNSEIIKQVEKDKLGSIQGITILFFPGDFSNESESTGLFIHSESIKWKSIPKIPTGRFQENQQQIPSKNESITESTESSKDHQVVKEIVNKDVEISEIDLVFRSTLQDKISSIYIETDGQKEIQSIFGTPTKLTYFSNGQRMTMQYPDKFYPIIITKTGRIEELRVHNPGFSTVEGIHVGSSLEEVIDAYGNPETIIELNNLNVNRQSRILYKLPNFSYYLIQDKNIRFFFDKFDNVSAMYLLSSYFINE